MKKNVLIKSTIWIICLLILIFGLSYALLSNFGLLNFGYESIEEMVHKDNCKVLEVLSDNDISLVIYKEDTTVKESLVIFKDEKYYKTNNKELVFKKVQNHYIKVVKLNDKYAIEVFNSLAEKNKESVSDSISSEFQYFEVEMNECIIRKWFLVLNELPKDYTIMIDNDIVEIKL